MALKGFSTLPKAPGLKPHHQIQISVMSRINIVPSNIGALNVFYSLSWQDGIMFYISYIRCKKKNAIETFKMAAIFRTIYGIRTNTESFNGASHCACSAQQTLTFCHSWIPYGTQKFIDCSIFLKFCFSFSWCLEFETWTRQFAFHIMLIPLEKIWIQIFVVFELRPGQKCHSKWWTGRKWHIPMAVMRGNRAGELGW